MRAIADVTEQTVVDKILAHLHVPLVGEVLNDGGTVAYDITGEPVLGLDWRPNDSGEGATERGPPRAGDGIDEPAAAGWLAVPRREDRSSGS